MDPTRWKQIEGILHSALELAPEDLEPYLNDACGGDRTLESEVRRLLSVERHVGEFLQRPAVEAVASVFESNEPDLPGGAVVKHFRIAEKLGSGGMGVVYKAEDTRLNRFVALKFLAEEIARDPEALSRFRREAQAASALNHPNICTVYDIGEEDGCAFLVMEYVRGKTLDRLIPQDGLGVGEALRLAMQVADGLGAAHAAGIVHRDLKPSNIMVAENGVVKTLDFGLAKLMVAPAGAGSKGEEGRHAAGGQSVTGTVMGTASYMSPEQVERRAIDARSDIFSFGVVLYEMVTGRNPFLRETTGETLAAILRDDIEPIEGVPAGLRTLLERCLLKDPVRRAPMMAQVRAALDEIREAQDSAAPESHKRRRRWWKWSAVAATLAVLAAAVWWVIAHKNPEPLLIAKPLTNYPGMANVPTFSPDGNQVAFSWKGEKQDNFDIYVKSVDGGAPHRLTTHPAGDNWPSWSPDGRQIAFLRSSGASSQELRLISPVDGTERRLTSLQAIRRPRWSAPAWTSDSKHLIVRDDTALVLVSVASGEKRKLTSPPVGWYGDCYPAVSGDGRTLAFCRMRQSNFEGHIFLAPLADPAKASELLDDGGQVLGLDWTADGRELVYSSNRTGGETTLWRVPATGGAPQRLEGAGPGAVYPAFARQKRRAAFARIATRASLWKLDLSPEGVRHPPVRIAPSSRTDDGPEISPDGRHIAFHSDRSGDFNIWVCDIDGANAVQLTYLHRTGIPRWSPDSRHIVFASSVKGPRVIFVISSTGGKPRQISSEAASDPTWSRDGRWIYFVSSRSGSEQTWKIPAQGGNPVQVTKLGGGPGLESMDGRYFYYHKWVDRALWAVPAEGGVERLVTKERINDLDQWTLGRRGLYFTEPRAAEHKSILKLFRFETGESTRIAVLDQPFPNSSARLSITPDDRWIVYEQVDRSESDIMLIENFH